jgi:hypothetical protein
MQTGSVIRTYGDFDGVMVPTETEFIMPAHSMSQVMTMDAVEYDTLEEKVFELPPKFVE